MSLEGQLIFLRMLSVSDDCGVVPVGEYTLTTLISPPVKIRGRILQVVDEIVGVGLGRIVEFRGKRYFLFKPHSFQAHQSYIVNRRVRSEYLGISAEEFDKIDLYGSVEGQLSVNCRSVDGQLKSSCTDLETVAEQSEVTVDKGTRNKVQGTRNKVQGKEEKNSFAEFVTMTQEEYDKLLIRFGDEFRVLRAIEILNNYKGSSGKSYKSDYLAMLSWVEKRLQDDDAKDGGQKMSLAEENRRIDEIIAKNKKARQ